jgi:hypothetical protein
MIPGSIQHVSQLRRLAVKTDWREHHWFSTWFTLGMLWFSPTCRHWSLANIAYLKGVWIRYQEESRTLVLAMTGNSCNTWALTMNPASGVFHCQRSKPNFSIESLTSCLTPCFTPMTSLAYSILRIWRSLSHHVFATHLCLFHHLGSYRSTHNAWYDAIFALHRVLATITEVNNNTVVVQFVECQVSM